MKTRLIDDKGSIIIPGIAPTGNLLWVDTVNGNDSLAVRGRLSGAFKTVAKAKDAAQSGDTIMVMPGLHSTDQNLAKNNVNWHLLEGATIAASTSASIFKLDSAITMRISGEGELDAISDNDAVHAVEVTHASADLRLKCRKISATNVCIRLTAGTSVIVEADYLTADEGAALDVSGGKLYLRGRIIYANQVAAVNVTGGTVDVEAYRIYSDSAGKGVYFSGGTAVITACEIDSAITHAVEYAAAYSTALTLRHAKIISKATPTSGNYKPALLITAGTGNLRIVNCTFIGANNAAAIPYSIDTTLGSSTGVLLYGLSVANFIKHNNVSLDTSRLTIDAALV